MPGFYHNTLTYTSIIKALSCRKDYSDQAIDYYHRMKLQGVVPQAETITYSLRAAANSQDLIVANDILELM